MDPDLQPTLHQRCEWIHTFPFRVFLFNKYKIKPAPRWLGLDSSWIWQKEHLRVFMRTQFYASGLGWSLTESQFHSHLSQRNAAHPVCDSTKYQSDQQGTFTSDFFLQLPPGLQDLVHVGVDQDLLLPDRYPTVLLQRWESLQQMLLDQDVGRLHRLGAISEFK